MRLRFIGSGASIDGPFDNFPSNILLQTQHNQNLLIDCSHEVRHAINESGLSHQDIDSVYISHIHGGHARGLEWLGLTRKFDPLCTKPRLYIHEKFINVLWNKVISGGMSSIQRIVPTLETFFQVEAINDHGSFHWQNIEFHLVQLPHLTNNKATFCSYGLFFRVNDTTIFITTDTQFSLDYLLKYYQKADLIFQDCETKKRKSRIHAHISELTTLPDAIKAKMWLCHYNECRLDELGNAGFAGYVTKGQTFDF